MCSLYMKNHEVQAAILDIGRRMYNRGFVAGNDGNISVRVGEDEVWISPSGVSKGFMTLEELVLVDLKGKKLAGGGKASSEAMIHLRAYIGNPDLRSVCHAHPLMATACSVAGIELDLAILPEAAVNLGVVPSLPYIIPGSPKISEAMAPYYTSHNGVLLAFHGAVTWGADPYQAYYRMETLEYYSQMLYQLKVGFGVEKSLSKEDVKDLIALREKMGIFRGGIPRSV